MFFLCRPYVTGYSRHWTRTHKIVMVLSLLFDRLCQKGQEDDDDYKDNLCEIPFPSQSTNDIS